MVFNACEFANLQILHSFARNLRPVRPYDFRDQSTLVEETIYLEDHPI